MQSTSAVGGKAARTEVLYLDNERARANDHAFVTTIIADRMAAESVQLPNPEVQPAPGEEGKRYGMPRCGAPVEGEPSILQTVKALNPGMEKAANCGMSAAQFGTFTSQVLEKLTNLELHQRLSMSELCYHLEAEGLDIPKESTLFRQLVVHVLEMARQVKITFVHEALFALNLLKPEVHHKKDDALFPVSVAVAHAKMTDQDDKLRDYAVKKRAMETETESARKKAKGATPHPSQALPKPKPAVSNGGRTTDTAPKSGSDAGGSHRGNPHVSVKPRELTPPTNQGNGQGAAPIKA
jgi:hypothetical protein